MPSLAFAARHPATVKEPEQRVWLWFNTYALYTSQSQSLSYSFFHVSLQSGSRRSIERMELATVSAIEVE
jgi:hypothetical protein